jgi:hypothetical protein
MQLHGLISNNDEQLLDSAPEASHVPIRYVEPPQSSAFRPPIPI